MVIWVDEDPKPVLEGASLVAEILAVFGGEVVSGAPAPTPDN